MLKSNGIHHLAIMTADMKAHVDFWSDVLGAKLVAMYYMHGTDGYFHCFMELNGPANGKPACHVAFVQCPGIEKIPSEVGVTHAGNVLAPSSAGTMQHFAVNVDTEEELLAMRDRIRSKGVRVQGPLDHGFCQSIYFAGPENTVLEVCSSLGRDINGESWVDPVVQEKLGISDEELAAYKNPKDYSNPSGPIPQPPISDGKPIYAGMPDRYSATWDWSDKEVFEKLSEPTPPVDVEAA